MPSENTLKIINDLKAAGLDISSLERQILVNPLADKQADLHLGGGILRQSEYTRYMNDLKTKETTLNQQLNQLASLHDVENSGVQLSQEQKDAIKKMEDALIATGEFEEESIKNLSRIAMKPVVNVKKPDINPNLNPNPNQNPTNFQQQDLSKYVDVNTLQSSLANMAYGGIATSMEIQAALDEVKGLGIAVDRKKVREFQEKLRTGYEAGKNLDEIVEETFEVSKALEAKQNQEIENRINAETERRLAEKLKEAGVPETNKFSNSRRHVLFDKNRKPQNIEPPKEGEEAKTPNELPRNKFGDTEIFRGRRNREDRMQGASAVLDEVMAHYANDPTYVE